MKPKSKHVKRDAIGRAVNKLRGPLTATVCRTCAAVVGTKHAAAIAERLADGDTFVGRWRDGAIELHGIHEADLDDTYSITVKRVTP